MKNTECPNKTTPELQQDPATLNKMSTWLIIYIILKKKKKGANLTKNC